MSAGAIQLFVAPASRLDQEVGYPDPLLRRAVTPLDPLGRGQFGDLADPFEQSGMPGRGRVSVRTRDR